MRHLAQPNEIDDNREVGCTPFRLTRGRRRSRLCPERGVSMDRLRSFARTFYILQHQGRGEARLVTVVSGAPGTGQ